jgi:hypothetical protein
VVLSLRRAAPLDCRGLATNAVVDGFLTILIAFVSTTTPSEVR